MPSLEFLGSFLAIVCVRKFPKEPTSLLCPQYRRNLPEIVNFFVCCSWSSRLKCTVEVIFFALEIKRRAKQPFRVPVPRSRQHHHIVKPCIPYIRLFSKTCIYTEYTTCRRPYMPTQEISGFYVFKKERTNSKKRNSGIITTVTAASANFFSAIIMFSFFES